MAYVPIPRKGIKEGNASGERREKVNRIYRAVFISVVLFTHVIFSSGPSSLGGELRPGPGIE